MALEWAMVDEAVEDEEMVERWLQLGFEPFAVVPDGIGQRVYFKKPQNVERDSKATEVAGSLEAADADS